MTAVRKDDEKKGSTKVYVSSGMMTDVLHLSVCSALKLKDSRTVLTKVLMTLGLLM